MATRPQASGHPVETGPAARSRLFPTARRLKCPPFNLSLPLDEQSVLNWMYSSGFAPALTRAIRMSKSSRKPRAFQVENPGYYRLSQDLQNYDYPPYLGIQSVRICPSCDFEYSSVDWNVEVLVAVNGQEYRVHIYTPKAFCPGATAQVVPSNCVVVPVIDGGSVAHAVGLIARQGLESPRESHRLCARLIQELGEDGDELFYDSKVRPSETALREMLEGRGAREAATLSKELLMLWPDPKPLPAAPWNALKLQIADILKKWELGGDERATKRRVSAILGCIRRKPYLAPLDLVEGLLSQELDLSQEEHHKLAEEIFARYQEFATTLFPFRSDRKQKSSLSPLNRGIARRQIKEVRKLFLQFDPLGLGKDAPEHEYDHLVLRAVGLQRFYSELAEFQTAFRCLFPHAKTFDQIDGWSERVWHCLDQYREEVV